MKIKTTILSLLFTLNAMANITLPWDSLFASYGLSRKVAMMPLCISKDLNLKYNDGQMVGIWGLTTPVARKYGLRIDAQMDERYDVRLSTEVAAKYMKDLVKYYDNEEVAILAYLNGAPLLAYVANMYDIDLKSVGEEDMTLLYEILPKNTICDSTNFNSDFFLDSIYNRTGYKKYEFKHPIRKETLQDSINLQLGIINAKILQSAHWINEIFVPETLDIDEKLNRVYENEIAVYKEELIAIAEANATQERVRAAAIKQANAVKVYVVKSGDTLGHIAKRYKVTVAQLKQWNGLKSDFLRIGQKLKIKN